MRRSLFFAAAAAFVSMVVVVVTKTFADTVVLAAYGVEYVPHFFVAQAAATITGAAAYGALVRRSSLWPDALVCGALVIAASTAPALVARGGAWPFAAALAVSALAAMAAMVVWNAATGVVSGRAARTFIPQAGAAATLGAVMGGLLASAVVAVTDVATLAPVAAGFGLLMAAQVITLVRRRDATYDSRLRPSRNRSPRSAPSNDGSARRLVIMLAAAAVVEALLSAVVELGFKREVSLRFDGESMGVFFALFYGGTNAVLLLLQLTVASRVLAAQSLRVSLAVQPALLVLGGIAWALAPTVILAGITRGAESTLKFGLSRPAQEIALSPLRDSARRRWKVLLRGVFSQGGAVVGGLALIGLAPLLTRAPAIVPACAAALAAVWFALQLGVARRYLDTLGSALGLLRLSRSEREDVRLDRDGVAKVVALVCHEQPEIAEFGREILDTSLEDALALVPHLGHRDRSVREAIYAQLARRPDRRCLPRLRVAVLSEPQHDPARGALAALAAHGDLSAIGRAREVAAGVGPDEAMRRGPVSAAEAWAYLVQVGALDADPTLHAEALAALLPVDGARAATLYRAAVDRGALSGEQADAAVIEAMPAANGLCAAAALGRSKPLVELLKAIDQNVPGAAEAMAHLDDGGLGRFGMLLTSRAPGPRTRARVARALRGSRSAAAAELAARWLRDEEEIVRELAAHTLLRHIRDAELEVPTDLIELALCDELDRLELYVRARWSRSMGKSSMVFRHGAEGSSADLFLLDELERRTEKVIEQVCALLALLGNPGRVYAAQRALAAPTLRNRQKGLDILQEVARSAHRSRLFELLERYVQPGTSRDAAALRAVCTHDPWLEWCAGEEGRRLQFVLWALRATQLFDRVDGAALTSLAALAIEERLVAGTVIETASLMIVMSGTVEEQHEGRAARRLGAGQAHGLLALVEGTPDGWTLRAVSDAAVLRLDRAHFEDARREHPALGLGLLRGLATALRHGNTAHDPASGAASQ